MPPEMHQLLLPAVGGNRALLASAHSALLASVNCALFASISSAPCGRIATFMFLLRAFSAPLAEVGGPPPSQWVGNLCPAG